MFFSSRAGQAPAPRISIAIQLYHFLLPIARKQRLDPLFSRAAAGKGCQFSGRGRKL